MGAMATTVATVTLEAATAEDGSGAVEMAVEGEVVVTEHRAIRSPNLTYVKRSMSCRFSNSAARVGES
jgi:hypothetical protein